MTTVQGIKSWFGKQWRNLRVTAACLWLAGAYAALIAFLKPTISFYKVYWPAGLVLDAISYLDYAINFINKSLNTVGFIFAALLHSKKRSNGKTFKESIKASRDKKLIQRYNELFSGAGIYNNIMSTLRLAPALTATFAIILLTLGAFGVAGIVATLAPFIPIMFMLALGGSSLLQAGQGIIDFFSTMHTTQGSSFEKLSAGLKAAFWPCFRALCFLSIACATTFVLAPPILTAILGFAFPALAISSGAGLFLMALGGAAAAFGIAVSFLVPAIASAQKKAAAEPMQQKSSTKIADNNFDDMTNSNTNAATIQPDTKSDITATIPNQNSKNTDSLLQKASPTQPETMTTTGALLTILRAKPHANKGINHAAVKVLTKLKAAEKNSFGQSWLIKRLRNLFWNKTIAGRAIQASARATMSVKAP
jgi:hypothetical protein